MSRSDAERPAGLPTRHHLYLLAVVALVETANRLGSPRLVDRLAAGLAALAYRCSRTKRRAIERNAARVLGPLSATERARIARGTFRTFWDETMAFVPWRGAAAPRPEIVGLSHLEAALARGTGAILWESGFFGRRNIAKQALQHAGFAVDQVHDATHRAGFRGDPHPSWVRDRIVLPYFAARERQFTRRVVALPTSGSLAFTRTLLAVLQGNGIVCITADVPHGQRLVTLSLLGEPKRFATGMVSLAQASGATLLPLFCVRDPRGRTQVIIEPAIAVPASGDREARSEAPLRQYAALLETYVRRHPEQYHSWHYPWWETTA